MQYRLDLRIVHELHEWTYRLDRSDKQVREKKEIIVEMKNLISLYSLSCGILCIYDR